MYAKNSFSKSDDADLGNLLGMLRTRARMSQLSLARLIGVSDKTIQHWENATSTPKAAHLKKLIEVYLHLGTFTGGNEYEEAKWLWERAALNAAFDEAWFLQAKSERQQPEIMTNEHIEGPGGDLKATDSPHQPIQSVFFFNMPLSNPGEFYGRRSERMTLEDRTYKKASTSIVGPRKIGKTWLMSYLKLVARTALGSRFRVAYLDATSPGCATVDGFTATALEELGVYDPTLLQAKAGLTPLERVVRSMKANNQTPVLCIDEFEGFGDLYLFDLSFLKGLRAMTQLGLVLVVASKKPLFDIVGENGNTSGFFNVFEQLTLTPFTAEEAGAFVQAKCIQAGFNDDERDRLLQYGQVGEQLWLPVRLQLVGKMLLEERRLAERESTDHYRPIDPHYWQKFEQRLEEKYRGVVV